MQKLSANINIFLDHDIIRFLLRNYDDAQIQNLREGFEFELKNLKELFSHQSSKSNSSNSGKDRLPNHSFLSLRGDNELNQSFNPRPPSFS